MKKIIAFLFFLFYFQNIYAKAFIYCSEGSPTAFNPQITNDGTTNNAASHTIYNRLVEFEYGKTTIQASLAKSWKVSKDKKTYTFYLRKKIPFHKTPYFKPTRYLNADDVLFSFNRMKFTNHYYNKVGGGNYYYFYGMNMNNIIQSIKKINNHTIQMTLKEVNAPFLSNLAMPFMSVLSKEYADTLAKKKKKENIDHFPIGTGPFIFKKYIKDTFIRYKRNNEYWGKLPAITKLLFSITPDPSVRYQKLKTKECDLIIEPSPSDIDSIRKNANIKLIKAPGMNVGYLAMNTELPPFNNVKVRRAINMALNKKNYINAIYLNNAYVAKNPIPPNLWSYNKKTKDYKYNPKKAKALLKKAGYPNGFSTEIWTLPVTRPYNPNGKKMGELMQADLKKIGIKVKLISYDWPTYLKKARTGEHKMIQLGWTGDNGDPDNFLDVLLGCNSIKAGSNVSRWCHKQFNQIVTKAKKTTNHKQRIHLYKQAQLIFKKEAPWVTIAHSVIFRAMNKKVKGYKIDPFGSDIFTHITFE